MTSLRLHPSVCQENPTRKWIWKGHYKPKGLCPHENTKTIRKVRQGSFRPFLTNRHPSRGAGRGVSAPSKVSEILMLSPFWYILPLKVHFKHPCMKSTPTPFLWDPGYLDAPNYVVKGCQSKPLKWTKSMLPLISCIPWQVRVLKTSHFLCESLEQFFNKSDMC